MTYPNSGPPFITSPLKGATVARRSTLTITGSATENVGVTRVEFYVNGTLKGTDTTSPYTVGRLR